MARISCQQEKPASTERKIGAAYKFIFWMLSLSTECRWAKWKSRGNFMTAENALKHTITTTVVCHFRTVATKPNRSKTNCWTLWKWKISPVYSTVLFSPRYRRLCVKLFDPVTLFDAIHDVAPYNFAFARISSK